MFGFGHIFPEMVPGNKFSNKYRCYSVTMLGEREDVERGGKIIMPPSALDTLTRLNIQYPMLFKLSNKSQNRDTHCGVLEFVADEGRIYIPYWMMRNLLLEEGGLVEVENVSLQVATFAKFQPQSADFLDITNPKAVLENALRNFACLSQGDVLAIKYNDKIYELCVLETKPGQAVSIIECDMNVDFAPPVGYQEPNRLSKPQEGTSEADGQAMETEQEEDVKFRPFIGQGNRLDGKKKGTEGSSQVSSVQNRRGIPNYNYKRGTITFIRNPRLVANGSNPEDDEKQFEAFSGQGQSLRRKNRK